MRTTSFLQDTFVKKEIQKSLPWSCWRQIVTEEPNVLSLECLLTLCARSSYLKLVFILEDSGTDPSVLPKWLAPLVLVFLMFQDFPFLIYGLADIRSTSDSVQLRRSNLSLEQYFSYFGWVCRIFATTLAFLTCREKELQCLDLRHLQFLFWVPPPPGEFALIAVLRIRALYIVLEAIKTSSALRVRPYSF